MNISLVIPLYNEEESLQELTDWIRQVMEKNNYSYQVIFIDDGSSDNSWNKIEELVNADSNISGIKFRRNFGKSAALNKGFEAAQGDVVITMDSDLQDSPEEIPELYGMIKNNGYDIVSGWKKKRYDPFGKTLPSKFFNRTTRAISGIKLHDFNCGLKAYRKEVVKSIEVYGEMHRYIPVIAKWAGYNKISEKVVQHQKRKYGVTKFGMGRFIKGYLDLLSITFISKFGKRPMHLFGTLGSVLFFIGFVIAIYLAVAKFLFSVYQMTERPLFYLGLLAMIIGTQLFLTGFLAEMISRNSTERNRYEVEKEIGFNK
ncbi:MAG: glycosyltransferase [Bacteroidales bacterium]|nr:glycosyltransferase [Bacteroidales bacterium]